MGRWDCGREGGFRASCTCQAEELVSENENALELEACAIAPTVSPVKFPVKPLTEDPVKLTDSPATLPPGLISPLEVGSCGKVYQRACK